MSILGNKGAIDLTLDHPDSMGRPRRLFLKLLKVVGFSENVWYCGLFLSIVLGFYADYSLWFLVFMLITACGFWFLC
jgi:hypothetical protein